MILLVLAALSCGPDSSAMPPTPPSHPVPSEALHQPATPEPATPEPATPEPAPPLVAAARSQIGVTTTYDPSYVGLTYPGGDIPRARGVCTDVVIRAMRDAEGLDLQQAVHEDMHQSFASYPDHWGLTRPDKNIDHRRVPNLQTYFTRHWTSLPVGDDPALFQPGDIVTSVLPPNLPHIMIVSDRRGASGVPMVIHNIGRGAQEEDRLLEYPLTGHYRLIRSDSGG